MVTVDADLVLGLAPDVTVTSAGLVRPGGRPVGTDPVLMVALAAGVTMADVEVRAEELDALHRRRLVEWRVPGLAAATPMIDDVPVPVAPVSASGDLSRYALVRKGSASDGQAGEWLLESGRSRWQVRLTPSGLARLSALDASGTSGLRALLALAGMLDSDDDTTSTRAWEPHDRYFASRSRSDLARIDAPRPGSPQPGVRDDLPDGPRLPLEVPEGPLPDEPTLWAATENRRTPRRFDNERVPLTALGTLLWRTLRIQRVRPRDPDDPSSYDAVFRPVPSGGAMHASDLWLLSANVEDLAPGVWRYDPLRHELVDVATDQRTGTVVNRMVGDTAPHAAAVGVLTVRHARTSAKYRHWAYALELKDIGVIMHALQLTAPVIGLGVIPWGTGLTEPVARLLHVDPEVDQPIGEFVLGVLP